LLGKETPQPPASGRYALPPYGRDNVARVPITITLDRYGHLLPSLDEAAVAGLEATFRASSPKAATARSLREQ
jgi:hypothetical protein